MSKTTRGSMNWAVAFVAGVSFMLAGAGPTTQPAEQAAPKPSIRISRARTAPALTPTVTITTTTAPADGEYDPYAGVLKERGIAGDVQGITEYLQQLLPTDANRKLVDDLIVKLGDEDFGVREGATKQLMGLPYSPEAQLKEAVKSDDPEVAARSRMILETIGKGSRAYILAAALRTIQRKELKGATGVVIATIPNLTDDALVLAARDALRATVVAADAGVLREALKSPNAEVRVAAAGALAAVAGEKARADLSALQSDSSDAVKLAAARGLASLGDASALSALQGLLGSGELNVRAGADQALRGLTGQQFGFAAYDDEPQRQKAADAWKEWIAANGATVKLILPLREAAPEIGRTLVCSYGTGVVREYDMSGKQTAEITGIAHPWGAQALPNGNRLVAAFGGRAAYEYDARGKTVWKKEGLPGGPMGIQRLENGNTLMALPDANTVVEVKPNGDNGWSWAPPAGSRPFQATRLENGNTLVVLLNTGSIVEVNAAGTVAWELKGLGNPTTARRLPNGNTLVTMANTAKVEEFDRTGKSVWTLTGLSGPYDAQRLSNGNTLIGDSNGAREYDRAGKVVWEVKIASVSRVVRY